MRWLKAFGRRGSELAEPQSTTLTIDSPRPKEVACGLIPIFGSAFVKGSSDPAGTIEVSVEGHDRIVARDRFPVGSSLKSHPWAARRGFRVTINSFFLPNGWHTLHVRLLDSGQEVKAWRGKFRVENVGPLAEGVRASLSDYSGSKRAWTEAIDSTDFPFAQGGLAPWFDRVDAPSHVSRILAKHSLPAQYEGHFRDFLENGFLVLDGFVDSRACDQIVADLEHCLARGTFRYDYKGQRIEHLFQHSKATRALWTDPRIIRVLSALFDDVALPCQTLNFLHGSQQDVHQDTIHLTPYPAGYMCGVWVALEDIHPDSGPLVVYPGSHRLPRLYTSVTGMRKVRNDDWSEFGATFTAHLQRMLTEAKIEPKYYTPKRGAVLIWHENLAHGGSPRKNDELTRKSIVSHYFAKGGLAFYDSQGLPAILETKTQQAA
jgi:Phytanoyl-CoA dioxygenase (PhyH)